MFLIDYVKILQLVAICAIIFVTGGGGGLFAIVDGGGGAAVNKELRREVREISSRRPFLPTTDGGGPKMCKGPPGIARYARWPVQPW